MYPFLKGGERLLWATPDRELRFGEVIIFCLPGRPAGAGADVPEEERGPELGDSETLRSLRDRITYTSGDYREADTFDGLGRCLDHFESPLFFLAIPPAMFRGSMSGSPAANMIPERARPSRSKDGSALSGPNGP